MSKQKDDYYGHRESRPPRPKFHGKLPRSLRSLPRWLGWRFAWKERESKWSKIPLDPHKDCQKSAKTNDASTWSDLATAIAAMNKASLRSPDNIDGLGFVFADGDNLFGLDIDGCRDPITGVISELATALLEQFPTYAEISPSGMGIKLIGQGTFPGKGRKIKLDNGEELELYNKGRYFTITGWRCSTAEDVVDCSAALEAFREKYKLSTTDDDKPPALSTAKRGGSPADLTDDQIIDKITRTAKNAAEGNRLWRGDTSGHGDDDSAADLALCNHIAFYTASADRIDSIFRRSGLFREKWNRPDYRDATISKSLAGRTDFYNPTHNGKPGSSSTVAAASGSSFALTDMGNAERLIQHYAHDLKRCGENQTWYVWNGKRWVADKKSLVFHLAKEVVRLIPIEAVKDTDPARRTKLLQHAINSESKRAVADATWLAQSDPSVATELDSFDSDPMLLNCSNGTLNLKTGELREHARADLLTAICPTDYDPAATCPTWEQTLNLIFPADAADPSVGGNSGLITYLQRLFGFCLTGAVDAILPIFWGNGSNGKSTVLNTIRTVLGSHYAIQAPHNFLMVKQNESHPTELADLYNRRLVIATENKKGKRLDEPLIKWLTGGERIRARQMRQDFFEFDPTHKLILCTNHRPRISENDDGIWRRVALIPFLTRFWNPDKKRDFGPDHLRQKKTLANDLQKEATGILAWMVRGCLAWQAEGLGMPPEVESETEAYRADEDVLGNYLTDRITVSNSNPATSLADVFADFRSWCERTGSFCGSSKSFAADLRDRGYKVERGNYNIVVCRGFRLNPTEKNDTLESYNND